MKRVVTGFDENGKSIFLKIGEPPHTVEFPGKKYIELWSTGADVSVPVKDPDMEPTKTYSSMFPAFGETRIRIVEFDMDKRVPLDTPEFLEKYRRELPGFLEHMEDGTGASGMHATDSVDYGIVLKGKIELELDDGAKVMLETGDVVIQNGTRHAWHPHPVGQCTMLWILIGAHRTE